MNQNKNQTSLTFESNKPDVQDFAHRSNRKTTKTFSYVTWGKLARMPVYAVLALALVFTILMACNAPAQAQPTVPACTQTQLASVQVITENGGRVDWSHATNQIAYDRSGDDGYYDLYLMNPDGSNVACLTCDHAQLAAGRHYGNPAWHPSGEYIVFQGEKEKHFGTIGDAKPGFGRYSDIWLMRVEDRQVYQLTNIPLSWHQGVLHPHFSPDGTRLAWSQMVQAPKLFTPGQEFGFWEIKIADFAFAGETPQIDNIQTFEPGDKQAFHETHSFSPDGTELLFSSNFVREGSVFLNMDIFRLVVATGETIQLTNSDYNEHAHFSPDGGSIVWMSNRDKPLFGTDYWIMDADNPENSYRLTGFNLPNCPGYTGTTMTAADISWGPDGTTLMGYVQTDVLQQEGKIVLLEMND